jgi:tetratricopeptide (TPR) repeat protein
MTGAGVKFDARNLISITTRKQFVDALNELKDAAGKTVRGLAEETKIPQSTVGGYFSGRHVPAPKSAKAFGKVLRACGVPEDNVGAWVAAAARVRRNAGHHRRQVPTQRGRAKSADGEPARPEAPAVPVAFDAPVPAMWQPAPLGPGSLGAATPLARSVLVSLSPPLGRLDREPMLRGRDQLLGELTSALTGSGPRTYVLHGLGGVGKSTVALTLSQHAERLGHSVWWIAADSEAVLVTGMHALAVELGASPEQLRGSSPDVVWRLLEAQSRPWLLILDNADRPDETLAGSGGDVTDGNGWLRAPRRGQGMVLVTTRDGTRATWGDPPPAWLRLRSVSGLSAEDGAAVLLDLAGPAAGSRSDAEHLVTLLGGLPLGLRLVGSYLRNAASLRAARPDRPSIATFRSFAATMRDGYAVEPFLDPPSAPDATDRRALELIGRAWQPSFTLLADRGMPYARTLMHLLACFEGAPIPVAVLLRPRTLTGSGLFPALSQNALWATLRAMAELGLISILETGDEPTISVHPLVRAASLHVDDYRAAANHHVQLLVDLLTQATKGHDPRDPQAWPAWSAMVEHTLAPLRLSVERRLHPAPQQAHPMVEFATRAATFLRSTGQLDRAETVLATTVRLGRELVGEDDRTVLVAERDLARVRYTRGFLDSAEKHLEDLLPRIRARFGPKDPETLITMHNLGRVRHDLGQRRGAAMLQAALAGREEALGPDHRDTLSTRGILAECLRAQGRLTEAAREITVVLERQQRTLAEDHPAVLVMCTYLARVRLDQRDYAAAHELAEQALENSLRVLGPDHPLTLSATDIKVAALHGLGDLARAIELARQLHADRNRTLGAEHPSTLQTRHQLGMLLWEQGDVAAADQELHQTLDTARLVLGREHPLALSGDVAAADQELHQTLDTARLRARERRSTSS